jgi:methyl-accepting chemotaxis protein
MDEVTQQNSALVEENAATAKTLEQQARSMDDRVAYFRLRSGANGGGQVQVAGNAARAVEPAAQAVAAKSRATRQAVAGRYAAPKRVASGGGPVGRMQTALATAIDTDADWKEF